MFESLVLILYSIGFVSLLPLCAKLAFGFSVRYLWAYVSGLDAWRGASVLEQHVTQEPSS